MSLFLATPAVAEDNVQRAQQLFERAEVQFKVGEFKRALKLYKQAYTLNPLVGIVFNIGKCHQQLGNYDDALFHYRGYLEQLPDAPNRAEVERLMQECRAAKRAGATKVPVYVHHPSKRPVVRHGEHRAWFWGGVALSGALLATGAITGALNLSMSAEYKDPATTIPRRRELKDTGEALGVASIATLATAGAIAAVTTLLYFRTDSGGHDAKVAFSPGPGGGILVVGGGF